MVVGCISDRITSPLPWAAVNLDEQREGVAGVCCLLEHNEYSVNYNLRRMPRVVQWIEAFK